MVSLFQFPSNGKDFPNKELKKAVEEDGKPFQFPSNGKDFPNRKKKVTTTKVTVSIPFKREGLSEHTRLVLTEKGILIMFQFPSNGKDFPNYSQKCQHSKVKSRYVSIPFKREGLSEHRNTTWRGWKRVGFNSLQTGRTFRTGLIDLLNFEGSNGFNSLQTGRTFRTYITYFPRRKTMAKFQFPSNGKDFPNLSSPYHVANFKTESFNSLQTGRTFRTKTGEN